MYTWCIKYYYWCGWSVLLYSITWHTSRPTNVRDVSVYSIAYIIYCKHCRIDAVQTLRWKFCCCSETLLATAFIAQFFVGRHFFILLYFTEIFRRRSSPSYCTIFSRDVDLYGAFVVPSLSSNLGCGQRQLGFQNFGPLAYSVFITWDSLLPILSALTDKCTK